MHVEQFLHDVGWDVGLRDDARLARAVAEGEAVDVVYTLVQDVAAGRLLRSREAWRSARSNPTAVGSDWCRRNNDEAEHKVAAV